MGFRLTSAARAAGPGIPERAGWAADAEWPGRWEPAAGIPVLGCYQVGEVFVVCPGAAPDPEVENFARGLARDPGHLVVLLDVTGDYPADSWDSVLPALSGTRTSLRLMPARPGYTSAVPDRQRGSVRLATAATITSTVRLGQWLADRTGQAVLAQDGPAVLASGGRMFVPGDAGSGWLRLHPGQPVQPGSRRFPPPRWVSAALEQPAVLGAGSMLEPLPTGVWIHRTGTGPRLADQRHWLCSRLGGRDDQLSVVLGQPGAAPVPPEDIAQLWSMLDSPTRSAVRFVSYGPPQRGDGPPFGQLLADLLGERVAVTAGLPVSGPRAGDAATVLTLCEDGSFGWPSFAQDLGYQPSQDQPGQAGSGPQPPAVLSHRPPVTGLPQAAAPAAYAWAPGVVLEVIPCGLWLRPAAVPPDAAEVRCRRADPRHPLLVVSARPGGTDPLRRHAVDVLGALEPEVRSTCQVLMVDRELAVSPPGESGRSASEGPGLVVEPVPAGTVPAGTVPVEPVPAGTVPAGTVPAGTVPAGTVPAAGTEPAPAGPGLVSAAQDPAPARKHPSPGPEPARPAGPPRIRLESAPAGSRLVPAVNPLAGPPHRGAPPDEAPAGPGPEAAVGMAALAAGESDVRPVPPPAEALPGSPAGQPAAVSAAGFAAEPGSARPEPAAPAQPVPAAQATGAGVTVQPMPRPEACVIPPQRGIARERTWVRQALSRSYDNAANIVLRVLSETPGLRGDARGSSPDLLTDLVAVRLYLTGDPQRIDDAVRSAQVGPHVPFGRCVAAGLDRLPSYRGPARLRATLAEAEWQWYGNRHVVTEWSFCPALAAGHIRLPGTVDFLIWSMTARRANLLEPSVQSQVLFLPGTNFKVLRVRAGEQREVLLREVSAAEIDADGNVRAGPLPLDQLALTGLEKASDLWGQAPPAEELPERYTDRFASPPGLIVSPPSGAAPGPAGGTSRPGDR